MNNLVITPARTSDVPSIQKVLKQTWMDTYLDHIPRTVLEEASAHWHNADFLSAQISNPDQYFPVVWFEAQCIAVATAGIDEDTINLFRLYVMPEFQRKGVGQMLLMNIMLHFAQARVIRLKVEVFNQKGYDFYVKEGFVEVGRETEKIGESEIEEIIMEKRL